MDINPPSAFLASTGGPQWRGRPGLRRFAFFFTIICIATTSIPTRAKHQNGQKPAIANPTRTNTPALQGYARHPEALDFATATAQAVDLDRAWILRTLAQARLQRAVQKAVTPGPSGSAKNWSAYRARFVEERRIQAGAQFWHAHREALARAEQQFGVPAQIVVAIIGVETFFGRQLGRHRVLDALATLAFDFPPSHPKALQRTAFFRRELQVFLSLVWHSGTAATSWRGSYAGAMGLPQFMPSSWQRFAQDFDGNGSVDLTHSAEDAIGSVAHFLQAHGWKPGLATHYPVHVQTDDLAALLAPDIVPSFSVTTMQTHGVQLAADAQAHPGLLALVRLEDGHAPALFIAGTENFYALTRYNWSSYYARAVAELGQAIAARVSE